MNKPSNTNDPKVVRLKLTTWSFTFSVICGVILSILMLFSDFFSNENEWILKLCITQLVIMIVYSVFFDLKNDISKNYKNNEQEILFKAKQIENEIISKSNKLYNDTVEKCKNLEMKASLSIKMANDAQIEINNELLKILTWKKLVGILQTRINCFRKAYREDTEKRIKKMTEKERLNNEKKYLQYRKKRYYEIDNSGIPKMEEYEMLMFLVETLQDEIIKLKN